MYFRITGSFFYFFLFFRNFSRRCLPWLQSQASICFQEKWCCPGEQKWPSASSQRWPTHRLVISQQETFHKDMHPRPFELSSACAPPLFCSPQVALGISTLLLYVPTPLAATHQSGSVALLSLAIWVLAELRKMPKWICFYCSYPD